MSQMNAMKPQADDKNRSHSNVYAIDNSAVISDIVKQISKKITPVWPIEKFIACNPLQGFESIPFEKALEENLKQGLVSNKKLEEVNWQMIKWCGAILDLGQGTIEMPHRDKGFYFGFLKLCALDNTLHKKSPESKSWLLSLPESPARAIDLCLKKLGVQTDRQAAFLQSTLSYLPGWAGYIQWLSEWNNGVEKEKNPASLIDFLAVRLVITCLLWPEAAQEKKKKTIFQKLKRCFKK